MYSSNNNNKLMRVLLFKNTSPLPFLITFIIICLVNDIVISHAKTIGPPPPSLKCGLDSPKYFYPGLWNRTSLRKCTGATRPEKMCIIGGGSSGVHMGWLLKRRGFENTVLYEQNDRLGGFVWTRPKDAQTNVTRELGAAFLSPDYVEVREFLKRYNQTDVPLSVKHMMHFHNTSNLPTPTSTKGTASLNVGNNSSSNFRSHDIPELPSIYYNNWLKNYTGSNDPNINGKLVSDALNKYYAISAKIFGKYKGRFPPRPKTKEQLLMLNGTAIDFLKRNDIELLYPLMYQFFVLQGMGLLKEMSAYYMLKWCNPVSMQGGGFGNKEYPLAMLKDGYGGIINNMAKEVNLNVKYGHKVKNILRSSVAIASSLPVTLQFEDSSTQPDATCDFVILSGPITNYVRGSNDLKVEPILNEVSVGERSLFYNKQAMQFLVSLVEFENVPNEFQTLEFWPSNFQKKGSVIVRRDIGYAETGKSHRVGGIQSFSYYPYPQCNRSTHWEEQQNWAKKHNKKITKMLGQFYVDTYYFHYNNEEVMEGKIWDLDDLQMGDGICNCTLYVGGCASYETVEDSMHYNLQLVDKLIDQVDSATNNDNDDGGGNIAELIGHYTTNRQQEKDNTLPATIRTPSYPSPLPPFTSPVTTVIELLNINVPCKNVDKFLWADNETWTKVLKLQPGFVEKIVTVDPTTRGNNTASTVCTIWNYILWESYALWKSVPSQVLIETDNAMAQLYGEEVPVTTFPPNNKNGLNILYDTMQPIGGVKPVALKKEAVEFNRLIIDCRHIDQFARADNSTWTQFVSSKPGFKRKILSMVHDNVTNKCEMYTFVEWDSYALWKQVCGTPSGEKECAEIQTKFAKQFGFPAPSIQRLPTPSGLSVLLGSTSNFGPRLIAINGVDVVAYFSLKRGEKDVKGTSLYRRYINASTILSSDLLQYHPEPYEFWFSSNENAILFEKDPWKYIPAFGGHCTHGISSRNDLTPEFIADGRYAFTCINTTQWYILNGTLYMNSCGMYQDFIKDPSGDAKKSHAKWKEWFGKESQYGPINDRCFQNGGFWNGDPIGALIPNKCVMN